MYSTTHNTFVDEGSRTGIWASIALMVLAGLALIAAGLAMDGCAIAAGAAAGAGAGYVAGHEAAEDEVGED